MALWHLQESLVTTAAANISSACSPEVPATPQTAHSSELGRARLVRLVCLVCGVGEHFKQAERNRQLAIEFGYR